MKVDEPSPGTLGSRVPPAFNLILFALTFVSALLACLMLDGSETATSLSLLGRATGFALALLAILLAHEMGHFLLARRHGVDASWPYFIPAPLVSFIGTFGAVIRLRALPKTRMALIDIGASGPIFGFLVTLPVLWLGLRLSHVTADTPAEGWTLFDALAAWLRTGDAPVLRDGIGLGEPLLLQLFERIQFGVLPDGKTLELHPIALAGWFGLFVTALNLLPLGQLDGGHVLYAVSPRLHRGLGPFLSAVLVGLGVFTPFMGWLFWGLLTGTVLSRHPPLEDAQPALGAGRIAIAILCLIIFILSFAPVPLAMLRA